MSKENLSKLEILQISTTRLSQRRSSIHSPDPKAIIENAKASGLVLAVEEHRNEPLSEDISEDENEDKPMDIGTVISSFENIRSFERLQEKSSKVIGTSKETVKSITAQDAKVASELWKKEQAQYKMLYGEGGGAEGRYRQASSTTSSLAGGISSESNKSIEEEVIYSTIPEDIFEEGTEAGQMTFDYEEEEKAEEEELHHFSIFDQLDIEREVLDEPEPITTEMLKAISVELGQIRLCWPKKEKIKIDFMPNVILPDGYVMNTNKEKVLLLYTENFRVQYHARYPNRKPLLLCGDNVAGQRKMVCTTLRPTTLPHPNLSTWYELATFLADHVKLEPLDPPTKLVSLI